MRMPRARAPARARGRLVKRRKEIVLSLVDSRDRSELIGTPGLRGTDSFGNLTACMPVAVGSCLEGSHLRATSRPNTPVCFAYPHPAVLR